MIKSSNLVSLKHLIIFVMIQHKKCFTYQLFNKAFDTDSNR